MKKIFVLAGLLICFYSATAQSPLVNPRTVNASGSAEMEIVPDEIYVQIDLMEYERKGAGKVNINTIKADFLRAMQSLGFTDKDISVNSQSGYNHQLWYHHRRKKEDPDLKAGISYQIKISDAKRMDHIVEKLDDQATQNFFVSRYTHSRINEYREQLRMQSLKNAREKAAYYAGALGEQLGKVLTINEPQEQGVFQSRPMYMAKAAMETGADEAAPMEVDYKKMKLQFECNVTFLLL